MENMDEKPLKTEPDDQGGTKDLADHPRPASTEFLWQKPTQDESCNLHVKEASLDIVLAHGKKLAQLINNKFGKIYLDQDSSQPESCILGATYNDIQDLEEWVHKFNDLEKDVQNFEVQVGVVGATGAGKTALLCSLLGMRDILPSSNEEAATASVTEVCYNSDDRYEFRFRAKVYFQSREELLGELNQFFHISKNGQIFDVVPDADPESMAAYNETIESLHAGLEKIQMIWGLEKEQLRGMTGGKLIDSDKTVASMLGRKLEIHNSDPNVFGAEIKPFVESSTKLSATPLRSLSFPVWPLVKKARIYLKSDLLRNRITLVDLPGLADKVESRARVARRKFAKLAVTIATSPIQRAADEVCVNELISDSQANQMRLNGTFNPNSLAVVLSKIDDIDASSFLKDAKHRATKEMLEPDHLSLQELTGKVRELKKEREQESRKQSSATKNLKKMKSERRIAHAKAKKSATLDQWREEKKEYEQRYRQTEDEGKASETRASVIDQEIASLLNKHKYLACRRAFYCIQARNEYVVGRIQSSFRRRLQSMMGSTDKPLNDIQVFPVCARAFWETDSVETIPGFPSQNFTGIPALLKFIRTSTRDLRVKSFAGQLAKSLTLLNRLSRWTAETDGRKLTVSRRRLYEEVLRPRYKALTSELMSYFNTIAEDTKNFEMMSEQANKTRVKAASDLALQTVGRFAYTEPRNKDCVKRLHFATYLAAINHLGTQFNSAGKDKIKLHWNDELTNIFLEMIAGVWDELINHQIPALESGVSHHVHDIMKDWYRKTGQLMLQIAPGLDKHLQDEQEKILRIHETVTVEIERELDLLRKCGPDIHEKVYAGVQKSMDKAYKAAANVEKGQGRTARAREALFEETKKRKNSIFADINKNITNKLREARRRLPTAFLRIAATASSMVSKQINALLSNVTQAEEADFEGQDREVFSLVREVKEKVRQIVRDWEADWASQKLLSAGAETDMLERYEIPKDYPPWAGSSGDNIDGSDESLLDDNDSMDLVSVEDATCWTEGGPNKTTSTPPTTAMDLDSTSNIREQGPEIAQGIVGPRQAVAPTSFVATSSPPGTPGPSTATSAFFTTDPDARNIHCRTPQMEEGFWSLPSVAAHSKLAVQLFPKP